MSMTALLAVAIQVSNPRLPQQDSRRLASWVYEEARARRLDPWVIHALVNRETHWTASAVRHESNGTCSVGLGQINVPCTAAAMQPLLGPHVNLRRMGHFLAGIRAACRHDCDGLGWLRAYNPGDAEYLSAVQADVRKHHAEDGQPPVRRVRADVHVSGVRVQAADRAE